MKCVSRIIGTTSVLWEAVGSKAGTGSCGWNVTRSPNRLDTALFRQMGKHPNPHIELEAIHGDRLSIDVLLPI